MNEWKIGLSSWIIQDGNYGNVRCNERVDFTLEFYAHDWQLSSSQSKHAEWIRASTYNVNAEVAFVSERCFVIDFGVLAYRQTLTGRKPKSVVVLPGASSMTIRKGTWIQAEVYLGVDPFFYFEDLALIKGMPPLIYSWHISKIAIETAPFIEKSTDAMGRVMVRDESKSAFQEIQQTNAWDDDNGYGEYVLDCTLIDVPPKRDRK